MFTHPALRSLCLFYALHIIYYIFMGRCSAANVMDRIYRINKIEVLCRSSHLSLFLFQLFMANYILLPTANFSSCPQLFHCHCHCHCHCYSYLPLARSYIPFISSASHLGLMTFIWSACISIFWVNSKFGISSNLMRSSSSSSLIISCE